MGRKAPGCDRRHGWTARQDQEDHSTRDRRYKQRHGRLHGRAGGVKRGGREAVRKPSALRNLPRRSRGGNASLAHTWCLICGSARETAKRENGSGKSEHHRAHRLGRRTQRCARHKLTPDLDRPSYKRPARGGLMFDLIISGGDVVTPQGVVHRDVAIAGETIAAIAAADVLSAETAKRVINATGHIVIPGGIDPHVHLHHVWIKPDGTPLVTAGPEQVGRAALHGGTTTFIDFAYWRDGATALQAIENRDKDFVGKTPCDWAYHIMLHSEPPPEFSSQLAEAIQAGYPTLKIFTTNILPSRSGRMIDFGDIWEAFQVLAREGGLGVIHAEDNDIVMHMYAKLVRE